MPVFDTAALLDALAPPVFRHEGREWAGRHLSIHELLRIAARVEQAGALSLLDAQRLYRELADEMFPPASAREERHRGWFRYSRRRRRVPPDEPSVADVLETLPFAVQSELIADFIGRQANAQRAPAPGRETREAERAALEAAMVARLTTLSPATARVPDTRHGAT